MPGIPDPCTRQFGILTLQKHLAAFQQEIDGVRAAEDIECIHRMRVATRRLRTTLPIFKSAFPEAQVRVWLKHIRRMTRALGAARDTDVQMEFLHQVLLQTEEKRYRPGIQRLILRLSQTRQHLQEGVKKALDLLLAKGVLEDMHLTFVHELAGIQPIGSISQPLYRLGCDTISLQLDAFLSYQEVIQQPEHIEELHAMRISAKWLRYSMETFASIYPKKLASHINIIRKVQETLGIIHDCDVWEIYLPNFYREEKERIILFYGTPTPFNLILNGLEFFRSNRRQERVKQYQGFTADWEKWTARGVWQNLIKIVADPITRPIST